MFNISKEIFPFRVLRKYFLSNSAFKQTILFILFTSEMSDIVPTSTLRRAPTQAEREKAEKFLPGAIKINPPIGPRDYDPGRKVTKIPIPKEALLENQGQSPMDYLGDDEAAAVSVSNAMANGRVPRYSDVPSFRAPLVKAERPKFVPSRMEYSILNNPQWTPPEEAKPKPMDVSTAEIVEKPIKKNATREALERQIQEREQEPDMMADSRIRALVTKKRHFIAYDDNDMFAYTTKHIALPPYNPHLPQFFDIVNEGCNVYVTRTKLIVISKDRKAAVHIPLNNEKISSEGWKLHVLRGPAPPPETPLVVFSDEWIVAIQETRCYVLTVDGWAWRRSIIPDLEPVSCTLIDLIAENTVYLRSGTKRHLILYFAWEDLDQEDIDFMYQGLDLDLRRGRLSFPKINQRKLMRTIPSEEEIHVIPGAGGVALSYKPTHTWIFLFNDTAKSYLPHRRIDFVAPRAVVLPSHIYFLAEHPDARGATTVCAKMSRDSAEDFEVFSYPHPDDVTLGCPPGAIACSGAMPESFSGTGQTAVLIADDWRGAVVVEFDRRIKLLKLHGRDISMKKKPPPAVTMMTPGT